MAKSLLTALILFQAINLRAQTTIISGWVKTTKNHGISGASIALKDTYDGASSDSSGKFSFSTTEKGQVVLQISAIGYITDSLLITLEGKPLNLLFTLHEITNALNAVVVTAGVFEAGDSKKGAVLNTLDVATTAGAIADVFGALQTLPGTQPTFSESGLFVRGGSASETKTFFDGMFVKTPFSTQLPDIASRGRFSPLLFKGTSFSAGGYSAQYGQALSSALLLESKDLPAKTTTGISILTVGPSLDHTQRFKNSALTIGGYYYNLKPAYSLIKQNRNWDKEPEQIGATLQYKAQTSEKGLLKWYSEFRRAKVSLFTEDLNHFPKQNYFSNNNNNMYINSTYQDFLNNSWKLQTGISYSNNYDKGKINADNYERTERMAQGRLVLTHYYSNQSSLKFGIESFAFKKMESFNHMGRNFSDQFSAVFTETDVYIIPKLIARLGLRGEYSSRINRFNVAPRTSLAYKTGRFSQVSVAYGRFYQNPEDDYMIQTDALDFERADHYIMNFQHISSQQTFRVEAFYKDYNHLTKTYDDLFTNSGDGYARGIDIFWRDKKTFKGTDYWITYSYLDSKRNFRNYPTSATPPFSTKHTANIVYKKYFKRLNTHLGATYTVASGRTYVNPNNKIYLGDKTKPFQNLSANISYLTHLFKQFTIIYVSLNNIPGFKNVFGYRYSDDGQIRRAITPQARRDIFMGILMTIGDNTFVR